MRKYREEEELVQKENSNDNTASANAASSMEKGSTICRRHGGWMTAPFILGTEVSERLAYSGSQANLITYLTLVMHETTLQSASVLNNFAATSFLTPLLGAFVADVYLGRFATVAIGCVFSFLGLVLLTLSASLHGLRPKKCPKEELWTSCSPATNVQMLVIYLSFALMSIGTGGIKPCVVPFGASQFDREKPQLKRFFIWAFFAFSIAGLMGSTVFVYIQDNVGWVWGFGIPCMFMLLAILFMVAGMPLYRYNTTLQDQHVSGSRSSTFIRMAQVIVAAARKWKVPLPNDSALLYRGPAPGTKQIADLKAKESIPHEVDAQNHELQLVQLQHDSSNLNANDREKQSVQIEHNSRNLSANDREEDSVKLKHARSLDVHDLEEESKKTVANQEQLATAEPDFELSDVRSQWESSKVGAIMWDSKKDHPSILRHTNQFKFLDKAAVEIESDWKAIQLHGEVVRGWEFVTGGKLRYAWRLCTVQQVEELKCMLRLFPIWMTSILLGTAISQHATYGVQQARTMDRQIGKFEVPAASMLVISSVTALLWVPFYDKVVIRILSRITGNVNGMTILQRIGTGHFLFILGNAATTVAEVERRKAARHFGLLDHPQTMIPMSAFWLAPQFIISAIGECFYIVSTIELFYLLVPENMTSTASALLGTATAIGAYLSSAILNVIQKVTEHNGQGGWLDNNINRAKLHYMYTLLTVLLIINFCIFLLAIKFYSTPEVVRNIEFQMRGHNNSQSPVNQRTRDSGPSTELQDKTIHPNTLFTQSEAQASKS